MPPSRGFTLKELLVVIFIVGLLLALLMPAIQSEHGGRRANCVGNLKWIGIALQTYHDAHNTFPPGAMSRGGDPTQFYIGGHAHLMPYFEEEALKRLNDPSINWTQQTPDVAASVIPVFVCPSNAGDNPFEDRLMTELMVLPHAATRYTPRQLYGLTTYVFCKGVTDSWCVAPETVPASERGLFDVNFSVPIRAITDGTANTIAMGEGACGPAWSLNTATATQLDRMKVAPIDKYGNPRFAYQAWIAGEPSNASLSSQGLYVASTMACTLEPMNTNPVTGAWADTTAFNDCRKSLPSAKGTAEPTTTGGPHRTPGFRSDHPGGANFLFADGSVHFLSEDIDMLVYQRLSTIAGGEHAEIPFE